MAHGGITMGRRTRFVATTAWLAIAVAAVRAAAADSSLIVADGSSTVYPITEAVAEEYQRLHRGIKVTIGISGTGGGFKKFCNGETDISDASRPIKPTEVALCEKTGVEYIELPVAYDGLAVVVNPQNDWVDCMTVAELKKIWEPAAQNAVMKWSQVRPGWPDERLRLFGAGVDSGTYDYFTEAIVGTEHASRGDFQSSEDDNVLVQGVGADRYALGFFGYAYYEENQARLKLLGIDDGRDDNGKGCVQPTRETVEKGLYQPLARPLFLYVRTKSAERPEVRRFVEFYLDQAPALVAEVGYIALPAEAYALAKKRFAERVTGSLFGGKGSQVGVRIVDLLRQEK